MQQWFAFKQEPLTPTFEAFTKLLSTLEDLAALNEKAMCTYEQDALSIGKTVLFGGIIGFALVLLYAIQMVLPGNFEEQEMPPLELKGLH